MSNRIKMIVGGICNLIVLVTFALIIVVLSENRVVQRVLASSVSELNSDRVVLNAGDSGSFIGKKESVEPDDPNEILRTLFSFKGIPYASPPLGELRWAPPVSVELKATPHKAAEFKPPCSQWSPTKKKVIGTPDCLYLNVYTPYIPFQSRRRLPGNVTSWTVESTNLLPVLVYVHGGELISGSASKYSPEALIKRERVVLVTFNYRLGVLGFLSSGDDTLPGNYGLMDQIQALKWINKYIHRFGGNPLRVTIFGSVEYLLLAKTNEENKELFHAAILNPQSTSVLSPFAKIESREGSKNFMKHLADAVGCSNVVQSDENGNRDIVDCLRKADTDTLIREQMKLMTFHNLPFGHYKASLGPVVDEALLHDEPDVLFSSGRFREVPLMVGLSANEGFNPFLEFYMKLSIKHNARREKDNSNKPNNVSSVFEQEDVKEMLQSVLQTVMAGIPDIEKNGAFERVFESIWNYYFGGISTNHWEREMDQVIQKLFRLFGDMFVNTGHCKLLHAISTNAKAPVFAYVFTHGVNNYFSDYFTISREMYEKSELMMGSKKRPKRSLHITLDTPWDEQFYLLHPLQDQDNFTHLHPLSDEDKEITDALVKIWTSFAKYAQPKQAISELTETGKWTRMEPDHKSLNYYLISIQPLQRGMRSDFRKAECQFWMGHVPQVRTLSKAIQELEPFPILFWSSVAVVILFALIIVTLIVLILCAKYRQGSYGRGNGIYLHHARQL